MIIFLIHEEGLMIHMYTFFGTSVHFFYTRRLVFDTPNVTRVGTQIVLEVHQVIGK